jgi:hypothetical protein
LEAKKMGFSDVQIVIAPTSTRIKLDRKKEIDDPACCKQIDTLSCRMASKD